MTRIQKYLLNFHVDMNTHMSSWLDSFNIFVSVVALSMTQDWIISLMMA
jgi:hypothetical protein